MNNLTITIKNIMNLIKPGPWSIESVKTILANSTTTYSQVDYYYTEHNIINKFN